MAKQQDLRTFGACGQATPVHSPTKRDFILLFIDGYRGKLKDKFSFGPVYTRIVDIEGMELATLRATKTTNTALQPMVTALRNRGIEVADTVGSLMDTVGFTQDDFHNIVCHCHGAIVSGHQLAERLRKLPDAQ